MGTLVGVLVARSVQVARRTPTRVPPSTPHRPCPYALARPALPLSPVIPLFGRQTSVGTRGGEGRMWGPCACPGGSEILLAFHAIPMDRVTPTRTSTRPPLFSASAPCPYRTEADVPAHCRIQSANERPSNRVCSNEAGCTIYSTYLLS